MIMRQPLGFVALAVVLSIPAHAQTLTNCRPVADCGTSDTPCYLTVDEFDHIDKAPAPLPGVAVFRVRICEYGTDTLCRSAHEPQVVTVTAFSGQNEIWGPEILNTSDLNQNIDTGPHTHAKGLTHLRIRCNNASPDFCKVVWQICLEEVPPAHRPLVEVPQIQIPEADYSE